jgi:hypothetical protein
VNVIAHQTVAEKIEKFAFLQVGNCFEKSQIIGCAVKNLLAVVAAIDHVMHQPVVDWS